jgi:hypothetical protein
MIALDLAAGKNSSLGLVSSLFGNKQNQRPILFNPAKGLDN